MDVHPQKECTGLKGKDKGTVVRGGGTPCTAVAEGFSGGGEQAAAAGAEHRD